MSDAGRRARILPAAAAVVALFTGCIISADERAGAPCASRDECGDPIYDCLPSGLDDGRTCQVIFPPARSIVPVDAGSDGGGGMVPFVCWEEILPVMEARCTSSCHSRTDRSGSGLLYVADSYEDIEGALPDGGKLFGSRSRAALIKQKVVDFRTMPPFGSPDLTPDQRTQIGNWVQSGAPLCDGGM